MRATGAAVSAREPIWTKGFCLVCFSSFFVFVSMHMLMPVLPAYVRSWGVREGLVGTVTGAFAVSALAARPVVGRELDRRVRKTVYLQGLALLLLAVLSYRWAPGLGTLLAIRIFHGVGFGTASTAAGTIVADLLPSSRRGEGMGYFGMFNSLAMVVAPVTGIYLASHLGYSWLFTSAGGLVAVAALLAMRLPVQPEVGEHTRPSGALLVFEPKAAPASLTALFVALTYSSILTFLQIYAASRGIANIGVFFSVYAAIMVAIRFLAGRLYDRRGPGPVVVPGLALMAAALVLISRAQNLAAFLVAAVIFGLGFGAVHPALQALAVAGVPYSRRGAANATFLSALDIGMGGGAALFGLVAQGIGYAGMYQVAAVGPLAGIGAYWLGRRVFGVPCKAAEATWGGERK